MQDITLTVDDAQLRLLWAGVRHYRHVYADLRNEEKLQTALDCMGQLEAEADRRGIKLDARRDLQR